MAEPKITEETKVLVQKIKEAILEAEKAIEIGDWDVLSDLIFFIKVHANTLFRINN